MNQYRVKAKLMLEQEFSVQAESADKVRELTKDVIMNTDLIEFTEENVVAVEAEIYEVKNGEEDQISLSEDEKEKVLDLEDFWDQQV